MFKFLRKIKQKKKQCEQFPDFTPQQLVQRFHSESALCDPSHRHILIEAAEQTHAQIQIRQHAADVKRQAVEGCRQLSELQTSTIDLRESRETIHGRAKLMEDHISVYEAPIEGYLKEKTDENEEKIHSLVQMADMVLQATDTLEMDLRASAQRLARSRSKARMRQSMEHAQFKSGLDFDPSASCTEFGPGRLSVGETSLVELVKQTLDYLDEIPRRWEHIDTDALHKELDEVHELLEEYEDSTRRREERLALEDITAAS